MPAARLATTLILIGLCGLPTTAGATERVELNQEARLAVGRALEYLKRTQQADGSWKADVGYKLNYSYRVTASRAGHVGVTSLACMAFMAGGNLPGRGRYGQQVSRGLRYVLKHVRDGYVTDNGSRMYSHAFATLFLAEVYGMTNNPKVRQALKGAVKLIIDSQNSQGGWRYAPGAQDSDMSIVVCQVQALRAARMVGVSVPIHVIEKARNYVKRSARYDGSFKYQDLPVSRESFALTAAGVTALQGTAIYDDARVKRGVEYMFTRRHHVRYGTYFYYYGHYYAVQAMFVAGIKWPTYWQNWYPWIRNDLTSRQNRDGSWDNHVGPGETFATAMGALILQIPYRYLPIFQR